MNSRTWIRQRPSNANGYVLVVVAGIGLILLVLGFGLVQLGFHARRQASAAACDMAARAAADAGTAHAKFSMNTKLVAEDIWDNSTLPSATDVALPGANARFTYAVTGGPLSFLVTSTGISGSRQRQILTRLEVGSHWQGIGVKETVNIKLATEFATAPVEGAPLTIRSNSIDSNAMVFKAFVTVPGDVVAGKGGDPDVVVDTKATTDIQGETYSAPEELIFPPVQPPADLPYMGSITATASIMTSGMYDTINIPNAGLVEIGPNAGLVVIYVTGPTILNNGAELIVRPDSALHLYLGGDLEDKNSVGISNETAEAGALKIYGLPTCTKIDLKAKSDFYGAVYAPEADIILFNSGDFIGSIVANSFEMKNSGRFIFDTRLASGGINDPAAAFDVVRWWEN